MATKKATKGKADYPISVKVELVDSNGEDTPETHAYAFTAGGRFLGRAPIDKGDARLSIETSDDPQSIQVLVGPVADEDDVSAAELIRRGASRQRFRLDPGAQIDARFIIPQPDWLCWLASACSVKGTLVKSYEKDGIPVTAPVCGVTVEVYEVDAWPILVYKLPDPVLERIRDVILRGPVPGPIPGPIPEIDPPLPDPPGPFGFSTAGDETAASGRLPAAVPKDLEFIAATASTSALRSAIIDHPLVLKPLLCRYYAQFFTKQLVATTTTNDCGEFSSFFFRGCDNPDQPDLYFIAKRKLSFFDVTIYEPKPVACHTYWNYQCGTEVELVTTHPLAPTCAPCPDVEAPPKWVLAMAVGNLRLDRIHGTSTSLTSSAGDLGKTDSGAPFGGLCRLHLEFDSADLLAAGVTHYRVQWRRQGTTNWQDLNGECLRHYIYEVDPTDPDTETPIEPFMLGPETVGATANLYKIPPVFPPKGQWSLPEPVEDVTNAKFPTKSLPPAGDPNLPEEQELLQQEGKYELKVDLFKGATRVTAAELTALAITYRVPEEPTPSGTITTENASNLGLVADGSFHMTLHIDNNRCSAGIASPTIGATSADGTCGVLPYGTTADTVTMAFTATHPNDHATYRFLASRVDQVLLSQTGSVPAGSASQDISSMLGACSIGGVAAFAERIDVFAMATDGWRRLSEYDATTISSFVLTPTPPSP